MTFSTLASPGVSLQGGGGSGGGAASLPISGNGATVTASTPLVDGTQTWNNGAVTFTGLKFNATDTASNASSLLMDLQKGSVSQFGVSKSGVVNATGSITGAGISATSGGSGVIQLSSSSTYGTHMARDYVVSWGNNATLNGSLDLIFGRRAAANLRFGAADAAAPVAQTLSVQSVVAGTTNIAGANLTITGSQGTGTGVGGSIIFQVAPAGSSGSAQNALATALTIDGEKRVGINASPLAGYAVVIGGGLSTADLLLNGNGLQIGTSGNISGQFSGNLRLRGGLLITWNDGTTASPGSNVDLILQRDAANTLALRNGGTSGSPVPQAFRVYNWTDGTNGEYLSVQFTSNVARIGTNSVGTGTARELLLGVGGGTQWGINTSGHLITYGSDNTYDIGASGATRPRNVYVAGDVFCSTRLRGSEVLIGSLVAPDISLYSTGSGILRLTNSTGSDFNRLMFGGTTSSFPAIKRNATALETKLADDSAYAPHAMQYLDVTDGVTAPASATGRARIYVDTADGDLKVIFADGTVKTIVTDT